MLQWRNPIRNTQLKPVAAAWSTGAKEVMLLP